jgi:hypothetical protein
LTFVAEGIGVAFMTPVNRASLVDWRHECHTYAFGQLLTVHFSIAAA